MDSVTITKQKKQPKHPWRFVKELMKSIFGQVILVRLASSVGPTLNQQDDHKQRQDNQENQANQQNQANHSDTLAVIKISSLEKMALAAKEEKYMENPMTEIEILQKINHRHIIRHKDVFCDKRRLYHVVEYFHGPDLFDFVKTSKTPLSEKLVRAIFLQLLTALQYLHKSAGIAHMDISAENILINTETCEIKLIDFGAAVYLPRTKDDEILERQPRPFDYRRGKNNYMAPEVYWERDYCPTSADIYSTGVLLFMLFFQTYPYMQPMDQYFSMILSKKYDGQLFGANVPRDAIDLMQHMIAPASQRYTLADIQNHRWVSKR